MTKKKKRQPKEWGTNNRYPFLKEGMCVETNELSVLAKYYKYYKTDGEKFVITGYTDVLFKEVYDKCYGIFVNIYQNFMIDKYMTHMRNSMSKRNFQISRIISKSCFSVGVIELSNFFNQRGDQVFSLQTLETILLSIYPNTKLDPIRENFDRINAVVRELRDRFYAHKDFNIEIESDKIDIWNFITRLENYFNVIVSEINMEPNNYKLYLKIEYDCMQHFFNQPQVS